jgi:hyperosmotically inducible protein
MKFKLFASLIAAIGIFAVGCNTSTNTNNVNTRNANTNTTVVTNTATNTSATYSSNTNRWNANISREEYEKNRSEYEKNKGTSETIGQSLEDSWLWFKTKSALMTTSDLRDSTINVDVDNGVITLKGTVASAAEKTKANQVANGIEGKKKVVDQLKIAPNDSMTNMSSGNSNKAANKK